MTGGPPGNTVIIPTGPCLYFSITTGDFISSALEATQGDQEFVLVGEPLVIAAMVRQKHVHDGTRDKDDDG